MGLVCGVLALLAVGLTYVLRGQGGVAAVVRSIVIERTNEARTQAAAPVLLVSPRLTEAAQRKAEDMAHKGYFAHTSPTGVTPWYWYDAVGYPFTAAGENLAVRFTTADAVVRAWSESEGHRANLLNRAFTETGVGIARGTYKGREATFVVQLFGTPAPDGQS